MKEILLTQGKVAIVDDEDYEWLNQWKWQLRKHGPTGSTKKLYAGRTKHGILMHRIIVNALANLEVDHRDGNGLNNQKYNLRICTHEQNMWNRRPVGGISQYIGVTWHIQRHKWQTRIRINGKQTHLGLFANELEAARAYDEAARRLHGQFARLNFLESE